MKNADIIAVVGVMLILLMMVVPLPPFFLDALLAFSISLSLLVLLLTMNIRHTLEFSAFPSLLLLLTLFRLALNVSSTRLVLLNGYAGQLIETFGNFVVGGNPVVGFVVFLILVVIQFIVITKGAERVAEVAARFTLDAMPGKQMSVDADLNAGLMTEDQARQRRAQIQQEADFYGAMDGASKFVKGDAIAGLVITAINILGGFAIGVLQRGLPLAQAMQKYTLLTVGDGLVSQIPALLVSTATGIIVTRSANENNMGEDLAAQLLFQPRVLRIAGVVMLAFPLAGLPFIPFLMIGSGMFALGTIMQKQAQERLDAQQAREKDRQEEEEKRPESVLPLLQTDRMELELGYGLINMVDAGQGGDLLERITLIRRQIALELGIVVPAIRIRDNMQLAANSYAIKISGLPAGQGELLLDHYLAVGPGTPPSEDFNAIPTKDPAFGLAALWVPSAQRFAAESAGYTVVEPTAVLATHITQVIRTHAHELLGRQEMKIMLDAVRGDSASLVDELIPDVLTIGELQKVLQNLLREGIPVRNLVTILETLADLARNVKDTDVLSEAVREALSRQILHLYAGDDGQLNAVALEPTLEEELLDLLAQTGQSGNIPLEPAKAQLFVKRTSKVVEQAAGQGQQSVLLAPPALRLPLRRLLQRALPLLPILSYNEVPPDAVVQVMGIVGWQDAS